MGSSKRQTIGYWQKYILLYGLCRSPIDAFLELRGGNKTAWVGRLESSANISISAANLWGGEEQEGGIVGTAAVMFGEQTQTQNAYLLSNLSDKLSALRGRLCFAFLGGRWGTSPYPKSPAFKVLRILKGWDDDEPWYPEKAVIQMSLGEINSLGPTSTGWKYQVGAGSEAFIEPTFDDSEWDTGASPFASSTGHPYVVEGGYPDQVGTTWPVGSTIWVRRRFEVLNPFSFELEIFVDNFATVWINGVEVLPRTGTTEEPGSEAFRHTIVVPQGVIVAGENVIVLKAEDTGVRTYAAFKVMSQIDGLQAMNPAHILFDSLTQSEMQGEPLDGVDEASFIETADRLYQEGFGLCARYDHRQESVEQFQERILNVIGGTISQSRIDGLYRLKLIRGDYDIDSLPILTDADILEFSREPSNPNDSVNEVVVEWFDPQRKEKRVTAPLQNMGAVMACGAVISETIRCLEIPDERLANRAAARYLNDKGSPNNRFTLTTTRRTYDWLAGMHFRLQAPRRGIADMVCLVGENRAGSLRSGAMTMTAVQDVSHLPDSTYVGVQPGVDTSPSQVPKVPSAQAAMEAPYTELAGTLPHAELAALAPETGYVLAMAARPTTGMNYRLWTKADAEEYEDRGIFDWCPSAVVAESATIDPSEVGFTLSGGTDLDRVQVGTAALWGGELVRVDAIDPVTGAATFGRAVADTVIQPHAAGERIWFYDAWGATDQREYVAGEEVAAKALTRTGSQELAIGLAAATTVEMDQRAARPYPPGRLRVNDEISPSALSGLLTVTWAHRDRLIQADQLVDSEVASIGPEPGTTYTLRWYLDDVLEDTQSGVAGATQDYTPSGEGYVTLELESSRDGLASWQMHVRQFYYTPSPTEFLESESGDLITMEDGTPISLE